MCTRELGTVREAIRLGIQLQGPAYETMHGMTIQVLLLSGSVIRRLLVADSTRTRWGVKWGAACWAHWESNRRAQAPPLVGADEVALNKLWCVTSTRCALPHLTAPPAPLRAPSSCCPAG